MPPKSQKSNEVNMPLILSVADREAIAKTTLELFRPRLDNLDSLISKCAKVEDLNKAKSNILTNFYKLDNNDQYQRRENLRIGNFPLIDNERDLTHEVVNMLNVMMSIANPRSNDDSTMSGAELFSQTQDVEVDPDSVVQHFSVKDISTCHYTKGDNKKNVIVRFVSRQSVRTIYQNKKHLKKSIKYKETFIMDDITPLKAKTKAVVSKIPGVEKTFIRDGYVHCIYKKKHYKLTTPDDIFDQLKVDITPVMLQDLGLDRFT